MPCHPLPVSYPESVETERLLLRRPRDRDRGAWIAIWADPAVWAALLPGRLPDLAYAIDRFEHHLSHWVEHGFGLWLVEDRATRTIAGWAGASHPTFVPELADEVEVGWTLRRPYWGRGLATEAARVGIDAAFEHLRPQRTVSLIHGVNRRSVALAERLGMRPNGTVEHRGAGLTLVVYELVSDA